MAKKILVILWIVLLAIITAGVWFLLPRDNLLWLKFTLLALSVTSLLLGIFWWLKSRRVMRSAQQILLKQDIHCIQQLFKLAMHKIPGHRQNKLTSLYALPWYLVIGGGGEGKSSLLQQNGMELLLTRALNESDTEHYLRFWINDTTVVIEAGRRLFNDEGVDEDLWKVLSQQLLKYRPRQGLNGVVAVLGCDRLLKSNSKERRTMAGIYQEAVLALSGVLQLTLPLYVTFSRADTLADFTPFFASFSDSEIASPFGITFPNEATHRFDKHNFETQTDQLLKSLVNNQFELLNNSGDVKAASVIRLPYQLKIFLERVSEFFAEIGRENRVRKSVWIRGAYLFSGGQKGTQYDLLAQSVAEQSEFNLPRVAEQSASRRNYFNSRLFSHVFIPEKAGAGINEWRNITYLVWCSTVLLIATALVAFAGFTLKENWRQELSWRTNVITQLGYYSSNVQDLKQHDSLTNIVAVLSELRTIAAQGIAPKEWYQQVSVQQKDTARLINRNYHEQLNQILFPKLVTLITNELKTYNMVRDSNSIFESLRYYQMLFDRRKLDLSGMQYHLQSIVNSQKLVSSDDLDDFALLVNDLFTSHYGNDAKPDATLTATAASNLESLSPDKLIYGRIKEFPQYRNQIDIRHQLGDRFDTLFELNTDFHGYIIPELYTKQGYGQLDLTAKSALLRQQLKSFKVIRGDMSEVSVPELTELSRRIQKLYFEDYIYFWKNIIDNIHIRQAGSPEQLSLMLKSARDPANSPILGVLEAVVANTTLAVENSPNTSKNKAIASQLGLAKVTKGLRTADNLNRLVGEDVLRLQPSFVVNDAFSSFSDYLNGSGNQTKKPPFIDLINQFDNLSSFFDAALLSADPGKMFNRYALEHAQGGEDAIVTFQQAAGQAPNPLALWVTNLSRQAWQQVINGSVGYLNNQWDERVYQFYAAAIKGRFPFAPQGRGEVALSDFTQFFKPQGRIDQFIDQLLKPFVQWDNGVLTLNEIDGMTLPISQEMINQLNNAHLLSQIFFGASGQELALKVAIRAETMSTTLTEFKISESEQLFSYRQGPRFWKELSWPVGGVDNYLNASFYKDQNQVAERNYTGQWALFRMIFDGNSTATSSRLARNLNYQINDNHIMLVYTIKDSPYTLDKRTFESLILPEAL